MIQVKLDWQGWWLYRTPMSSVPQLDWDNVFVAVLAAKLQKVNGGVGCSNRELILFSHHSGSSAREYLENLPKTSFGAFIKDRATEIRKKAIVYVAQTPKDLTPDQIQGVLSLMYGAVPFAPTHHAMPAKWDGGTMHIVNDGKKVGLPPEIFHSSNGGTDVDSDRTRDPSAEVAMSEAIAQEAQITRRMTKEEQQTHGMATEKVPKPESGAMATERVPKPDDISKMETERVAKPSADSLETEKVNKPVLVETEIVTREDVPQGVATEKVPKPDGVPAE